MHPRRPLAALATVLLLVPAGCSGSALNADDAATGGPIRVGVFWAQSGAYQAIGADQTKGWQLYLDQRGGKLGGHPVTVTTVDEAEGKQSAIAGAKKLLDKDKVMVLAGTGTADSIASVQDLISERKVPFVGSGGRPSTLKDVSHIWHVSWMSRDNGQAIAEHLRTTVNGPVYAIGPDYQGGWDQIGGMVDTYTKAGGQLANEGGKPTFTPWPATDNFLPYLNKIKASGAKAVYAFYAGAPAVSFVKQYKAAGLDIPLYGAGFLTEGGVLAAEGDAADGVQTVLCYAHDLDNPANREFAAAYQQKHGTAPNLYALTGWDTALVLDQAIAAAGPNPTSASINTAIGKLGAIASPRGEWRFSANHTPIQTWYLRTVRRDGGALANVVTANLATLGS